jgi:hypothetical protein
MTMLFKGGVEVLWKKGNVIVSAKLAYEARRTSCKCAAKNFCF